MTSPDACEPRRRHAAAHDVMDPAGVDRPCVLVAGGGVAALEACLLLRAYAAEDDVAIHLLTPSDVFSYRPLSVLESFGGARTWSMPLDQFAADQDVELVPGGIGTLLAPERRS